MSVDRVRPAVRVLLIAAVTALAAAGIAACGGSDDGSAEAQSVEIRIIGEPESSTIEAPKSAEAGLTEITLKNRTRDDADAQLIRVEGKHSPAEVIEGLGAAMQAKPFPDWFFAGGGISTTPAGSTSSVTQILKPGTYYVFNDSVRGRPDPSKLTKIEVSGSEANAELPDSDAGTVQVVEYGFKASDLTAGENQITFENSGAQPHHILASKAIGNATAADAEKFFRTSKGKPPLQQKGTASTAVLEGGESQLVTLDLKPGKYILYCFISDRQGGPPHALKGMVDEVEVK